MYGTFPRDLQRQETSITSLGELCSEILSTDLFSEIASISPLPVSFWRELFVSIRDNTSQPSIQSAQEFLVPLNVETALKWFSSTTTPEALIAVATRHYALGTNIDLRGCITPADACRDILSGAFRWADTIYTADSWNRICRWLRTLIPEEPCPSLVFITPDTIAESESIESQHNEFLRAILPDTEAIPDPTYEVTLEQQRETPEQAQEAQTPVQRGIFRYVTREPIYIQPYKYTQEIKMQPTKHDTKVVMREGRFFRETVTVEDLGEQEHILRKIIKDTPKTIMNAFDITYKCEKAIMMHEPDLISVTPAHVTVSSGTVITTFKMPVFHCSSDYWVEGNKYLYAGDPCEEIEDIEHYWEYPDEDEDEADYDRRKEWCPPASVRMRAAVSIPHLHYAVVFPEDSISNLTVVVALRHEDRWITLMFPNIYDDGRYCLGHYFKTETKLGNTAQSASQAAVNYLTESWNNLDLRRDIFTIRNYFQFVEKRRHQIPQSVP